MHTCPHPDWQSSEEAQGQGLPPQSMEGRPLRQGTRKSDPRHCRRRSLLMLRFKLLSHIQVFSQEVGNRGSGGPIPTQQGDGAGILVRLSCT